MGGRPRQPSKVRNIRQSTRVTLKGVRNACAAARFFSRRTGSAPPSRCPCEALPQSIRSMLSTGSDLSEFPGIGKDLAGKIAGIVRDLNILTCSIC